MASIPGILGYVQPGAFSSLVFTFAGTGNPNGIRSVGIIGLGRREEYLVVSATGNGADGLSVVTTESNNYNYASIGVGVSAPNGMNFQTSRFPITRNQFRLFKSGNELIRSKDTVVTDAEPLFMPGTDYAVDFNTGRVLLAPAYAVTDTHGTTGYFENVSVPANVNSEVWTISAFDQPDTRATTFSVVGSKSGQIFGFETFTEQRNELYANGLPLTSGGIYYYSGSGERKAPPATSFLRSDGLAYEDQGHIVLDIKKNAVVTVADPLGLDAGYAYVDDATMDFTGMPLENNYLEFVSAGDPNSGVLYSIVEVAPIGHTSRLVIDLAGSTTFSNYSPASYVVTSSDQAGKNFYSRSIEVFGANALSTSRKRYYIRIFDSLPTNFDFGAEDVYMSPGQALYETSDDYAFDEVTGKWTGTWYRGAEGTGLVTNESDRGALGRQGSVPVYSSAGVFSGLTVNFAPPSGISDFDTNMAYYDVMNNSLTTDAAKVQTWTATGTEIVAATGSPIATIVSVDGVATLTSTVVHSLVIGRRVVVAGTSGFNGTYSITSVPTTSSFTFAHADAALETVGTFTNAEVVNTEFTIVPEAPHAAWTVGVDNYVGYVRGTLEVTVGGVRASVTEIPYDDFVGRAFRLSTSAPVGSEIVATFTVGDYSIARLTGFRKGDLWEVDTDGKYNNGLLSFSLVSGETPFHIGDTLTITVSSGALIPGQNLVASYVVDADVNDPEEFFEPVALYRKHGYPSTENSLALGAQLAFLNGARSVVACQAKPTEPLITMDTLLVSRADGNYIGNGGLYYTAHTHGTQSFEMLPEDEVEGAKSHGLMHARNNSNALTTLHRHDDPTYANPAVNSPAYRLTVVGTPYNQLINFFYTGVSSTTPRQVFLNKVQRSVISTSSVSIPCTKNFGYSCNTSGKTIPAPLNNAGAVTLDKVNNPFFLDSRSAFYLWIYPDGTQWWKGLPEGGGTLYLVSDYANYADYAAYVGATNTIQDPIFVYPDEVRNVFSTGGTFPDVPDSVKFAGYEAGTAFPCGALFRLRSGLDVNVDFGTSEDTSTYTEIDGRPLDNYTNAELAFNHTCTDNFDSAIDHFLKTGYNGGNNDPNNITIEDAMLYMHTQRDDMSYMLWSDNTIILSDRAGLRDGEGVSVHFIDADDAGFVDPEWAEAATAMESSDAYWIVPIPDGHFSSVQQTFRAHVESMSATANRRERQLLTGAFYNTAPDGTELALRPENLYAGASNPVAIEDIGVLEGIQGYSQTQIQSGLVEDIANYGVPENFGTSYRTVYFYPDKVVVNLSGVNAGVPGFYIAAAAGGFLSGQQFLADPLTWKNLVGFTVTRDRTVLTGNPTIANRLGSAGVTVVHGLAAGGKVMHCKSTIQSGNAFQEEPSSVNIADLTAQELRNGLSAQFIGKAQTPDLPHQMLASTKGICQSLLHRKLLNNFDNIQVSQDPNEPRQYNVRVEIVPVLALLWIYIEVQVGL